jgi:hypothetical protein
MLSGYLRLNPIEKQLRIGFNPGKRDFGVCGQIFHKIERYI